VKLLLKVGLNDDEGMNCCVFTHTHIVGCHIHYTLVYITGGEYNLLLVESESKDEGRKSMRCEEICIYIIIGKIAACILFTNMTFG
jgi:hypothetical protein